MNQTSGDSDYGAMLSIDISIDEELLKGKLVIVNGALEYKVDDGIKKDGMEVQAEDCLYKKGIYIDNGVQKQAPMAILEGMQENKQAREKFKKQCIENLKAKKTSQRKESSQEQEM